MILEDHNEIRSRLNKEAFAGKRILVTGGAGFLGSWLCDILIGFEAEVCCLDNLSTGEMKNIDHLVGRPNFEFIDKDVCTFKSDEKFNLILHFASHAAPEEYQRQPVETLRANSLGSFSMLELARKCNATVLFASTSEVYGDAEIVPTPESYWGNVNPVGPRSCYDEGKRFAEALFMGYHKEYGLDVRIARIFNTYGPRIRADGLYARAMSRFIAQAISGNPITVYGDGSQTRSFCYVADTILGLLLFSVTRITRRKIINFGNTQEVIILELARKIKKLVGSKSPITFHPLPKDDPKRRRPDINEAENLLKWKPRKMLDQGLQKTVRWFQTSGAELKAFLPKTVTANKRQTPDLSI